MFSARLPSCLSPNSVSLAVAAARANGRLRFDLTETNPTVVGLDYPDGMTTPLGDPAGAEYRPSPLGHPAAREAVAASYRGVSPERVVLTASTSEAYSLLFKLLCDAGESVLVPRPSYPLFELLTRLDGVQEAPYRLDPHGGWCLDRASLREATRPDTRAVLIVSPNNPTGSQLRADDREWLVEHAQAHDLVLISDEVFADYPLNRRSDAVSLADEARVLTFTLGGLSKSAGLPQMKLAWILVNGPGALVGEALERLAVVADSYLSVSTAVQLAAPRLIAAGHAVRASIQARLTRNLAALRAAVGGAPALTMFEPDGGWSAVLRVPAILSGEQLILQLLADEEVLVHPGYFFDLEGDGFVVTSLLPEPATFDEGVARLVRFVSEGSR